MQDDTINPYLGYKIYGPYTRKDGRQHVVAYKDGKRTTVSYPKYLMEQHLGRVLDPVLETIDHVDNDYTNNVLTNLQILPLAQHATQDILRAALVKAKCVWCSIDFEFLPKARDRGKAGPFCSRSCTGKYGTSIQHYGLSAFGVYAPNREYYRLKDKPG